MKPLSILTVAVATSIFILCTSLRPVRTDDAAAGVTSAAAGATSTAIATSTTLTKAAKKAIATASAKIPAHRAFTKAIPARTYDVTSIWRDYAFTGAAAGKRDLWLFWYIDDVQTYWTFNDVSYAVVSLEEEYGVLVDGNPEGTLLAGGYPFSGVPHISEASCFLYGHF